MLGVAYNLMQAGRTFDAPDFGMFKSMVMKDFKPSKVEAAVKVPADYMAYAAKELLSASKPVVVPSGTSVASHAAAFALNLLLGRLNEEGGMVAVADTPLVVSGAMTRAEANDKDLIGWLSKGATPSVLIVAEANPVYSLPMEVKADFMVSIATYNNETTAQADLVLPAAHPYERFDDLQTPYGVSKGVYTASVPVAKPELDVKAPAEIILALADAVGNGLGAETFDEIIAAKAEAIAAEWDEYEGIPAHEMDGNAEQAGLVMAADALAKLPLRFAAPVPSLLPRTPCSPSARTVRPPRLTLPASSATTSSSAT